MEFVRQWRCRACSRAWLLTSARFSNGCSMWAQRRRPCERRRAIRTNCSASKSISFAEGRWVCSRAATSNGRPKTIAIVEGLTGAGSDVELAVARAGCLLLDREKTDKAAVADDIEALKRWCAARIHDPAYRHWVVFHFPENIDPWNLVQVQRPRPISPSRCSARTGVSGVATASS